MSRFADPADLLNLQRGCAVSGGAMQFRRRPDPEQVHLFVPRKHGAKVACEVCGGTQWDRIHDVPRRRVNDGR